MKSLLRIVLAAAGKLIKADTDNWEKVIKTAGIKME